MRPGIATAGWLLLAPPLAAAAFSSPALTRRVTSSQSNFFRPSPSSLPPTVSRAVSPLSIRLMSSTSPGGDLGSSLPLSSHPTKWSGILTNTNGDTAHPNTNPHANLFPPLSPSSHKGSHGRIAIWGGSEKYTGAPYYAAQSALHCGIDLATVFCAKEAAVPIKCYSPELMVQSAYSIDELDVLLEEETALLDELKRCQQSNDVTNEMNEMEILATMEKLENHSEEKQQLLVQSELLKKNDDKMEILVERLAKMKELEGELERLRERKDVFVTGIVETISSAFPALHALCIGPGLGRHPIVFLAVEKVIRKAIEVDLTLILDADALFMLSLEEYQSVLSELHNNPKCVMTPNVMEKRRLDNAAVKENGNVGERKHSNIVVQKGNADTISNMHHTMQCEEEGGLKRSGGIGDVLAGTISTFMAWNDILEKKKDNGNASVPPSVENQKQYQRVFASWAACCAVKRGTNLAFRKKKRAMSALDVIGEMGEVLASMEEELQSLELSHVGVESAEDATTFR